MKVLGILFLLFVIGANTNAQTFSYQTSDSVHTELDWNTFSAADMYFSNNPVGAIQFKWELISNDMPTEWSYSLCDYTSCYPGIPSNGTMTAINSTEAQNGTMGFFKISLHPGTTAAFATVNIYVYDATNYNIGDTVTFTFNMVDQLSTDEQSMSSLAVYPNPASDILTVENINPDLKEVYFYNMSGELVSVHPINGTGTEYIDIAALDAGIYMLAYLNQDGLRETKKITVQ